ncbi:MAG TPA: hypothetical protein VI874_03600 [Candidatus Norongarragalinales archaeon]|nr:hypothetical protein [Candidatus Norongarragalinales archaeon]
MKAILIVSGIFFVAAFFGMFTYNQHYEPFLLTPPYAYTPADGLSEAYAFLFVFTTSFLFFGFAAPLALGIESGKIASLLSTNTVPLTHALFLVPYFFAAVSATYLGQGLLKDYRGEGLWKDHAHKSAWYLGLSIILWALVYFGRSSLNQFF